MSRISDEEIWLRAYCAEICFNGIGSSFANENAIKAANQAVVDFEKRFPKFQSVSHEKNNPPAQEKDPIVVENKNEPT